MKCDIQMTGLEINKSFAQLFCFYIPFMYLVVIVVPTHTHIFACSQQTNHDCFWKIHIHVVYHNLGYDPLPDRLFQKSMEGPKQQY